MRKTNLRKVASKRNGAVKDTGCAIKSKNYYYEGEYMETASEVVYKYSREQRYDKAISYMTQYFGLDSGRGIPILCLYDGTEFIFSNLIDVYYIFPFGRPQEHSMMIVRPDSTLFAYGNGELIIAPYIYRIGE